MTLEWSLEKLWCVRGSKGLVWLQWPCLAPLAPNPVRTLYRGLIRGPTGCFPLTLWRSLLSVCVFVFVILQIQIHHFNQRLGVFLRPFGGVYFEGPINQTLPAVFGPAAADHLNTMSKQKLKTKTNKTKFNQTQQTRSKWTCRVPKWSNMAPKWSFRVLKTPLGVPTFLNNFSFPVSDGIMLTEEAVHPHLLVQLQSWPYTAARLHPRQDFLPTWVLIFILQPQGCNYLMSNQARS